MISSSLISNTQKTFFNSFCRHFSSSIPIYKKHNNQQQSSSFQNNNNNNTFTKDEIIQAKSWLDNLSTDSLPPVSKFAISYSRSSGPGGQNVNKVSTKSTVKLASSLWNSSASWIPKYCRYILFHPSFSSFQNQNQNQNFVYGKSTTKHTISLSITIKSEKNESQQLTVMVPATPFAYTTSDGLVIQSDRTRSRTENVADCFDKLISAIKSYVHVPSLEISEKDLEKWQKIKHREKSNLVKTKKLHSLKKATRKRPIDD